MMRFFAWISVLLLVVVEGVHCQREELREILTRKAHRGMSKESNLRIINGEVTTYGDHPYACSLWRRVNLTTWRFWCGAVIYNPSTVLTAAHCVENSTPYQILVICGDYNLTANDEFEVLADIAKIVVHPDWHHVPRKGFPNDIALIQLKTPLVFNDYVNTLPIPTNDTMLPSHCQVIGWGRTEEGRISHLLREATLDRLATGQCKKLMETEVTDHHLCLLSTDHPVSSCFGDSGGATVCGHYIAGLTSFGVNGCEQGFPSVFTRLSSYSQWIADNVL